MPLSQEALLIGDISYHEYQGIFVNQEEKDKLARNLGPINKVCVKETKEEEEEEAYLRKEKEKELIGEKEEESLLEKKERRRRSIHLDLNISHYCVCVFKGW